MKCDPQDYLFDESPSLEDTNSSYIENNEEPEMQVYVEPNSAQLSENQQQMEEQYQQISYGNIRQTRKRKYDDEFASKMVKATKYLNNIANIFKENDDEFDVFGKSVATQLKQFSLCQALTVQLKIQSLLTEERIKEISAGVKTNAKQPSIVKCSQNSLPVSCDSEISDVDT